MGPGKTASEAAQRCTKTATHIQDASGNVRLSLAVEMKTTQYFLVHLLKHGLAPEGVHAPAKEAEVHVVERAPGRIVRTGLLVVTLKAGTIACSCRRRSGKTRRHQSNLRLRAFGSIRVTPLPMLTSERRLAGGNCLIWLYHSRRSSRKTCMAVMRAAIVGWEGRSACASTAQRRS